MGRTARRRREPYLPPVKKIELTSAHSGRRLTIAAIFLAIGVVALVYGFTHLNSAENGWQQIETQATDGPNCGEDFVLLYDIGASGTSAREEKIGLTNIYSDAAQTAYRLFTDDAEYEGLVNVRYLNAHPNETLTVDPALYSAFAQVQASGDRSLYLGPVYSYYDNIFYCTDSALTAEFDPRQDEQTRRFNEACCAFANDPAAVDLELMDDDQVRLNVSEEYLAFAREQEIDCFIDFYWMKNAFIADYLAQRLISAGYVHGALSSYDGFTRNLSAPEAGQFGFNVFDGSGSEPVPAATMVYSGDMSIVYLHSYPMGDSDARRYFTLSNGEIRSAYLDTADGTCRSAISDLVVYSRTGGCAETLLRAIQVYVADTFRPEALTALAEDGVYAVYCRGNEVVYNEPELTLTSLYEAEDIRYTAVLED